VSVALVLSEVLTPISPLVDKLMEK